MFEQVKSQKLYLQIVNQVRTLLTEGKLKAGDKLPTEIELSKEFGTSRACIREAMSALKILGLLESKSGQGNYIKADGADASIDGEVLKELLKDHSPFEVFEARYEIEPILSALAAERSTPEDIEKLNECLIRLNDKCRHVKNDPKIADNFLEEDRKFHLHIARAAYNTVLFTMYSGVNLMLKEKHWKVSKKEILYKKGNLEKFESDHTEIFKAISNGDSKRASFKMREHLEHIKRDMFDE